MICVDISHWDKGAKLEPMVQGGAELFIFRSTIGGDSVIGLDDAFADFCQQANALGVPFGAYHFDDPFYTPARQLVNIQKQMSIAGPGLKFLAQDVEKERPFSGAAPYNPANLAEHTETMYTAMVGLGLPMLFYSRTQWINTYCPQLWSFLKNKSLWLAAYPTIWSPIEGLSKTIITDWTKLKSTYIPRLGTTVPTVPAGQSCVLWQFSGDRFCLPGSAPTNGGRTIAIDLSINFGTLDTFMAQIGTTAGVPLPAGSVKCPKCGNIFVP